MSSAAEELLALHAAFDSETQFSSKLLFYLNGNAVEVDQPDPEENLLSWLRRSGYYGTKLGCGEGGCGACTVLLSHMSASEKRIVHLSVNACLFPLCACDSCHIITVEGIGQASRMHPIQERMSDFHGSQCGFCTPGIVMSMYALLRNNPLPTASEIEENFDGNLCRCTGYRPILDAFKTFSLEHARAVECMQSNTDGDAVLADSPQFKMYSSASELIFPPALLLRPSSPLLIIKGTVAWFKPLTLKQLLVAKRLLPRLKIINGNTEVELERKFAKFHYSCLVSGSHIPELNTMDTEANGVRVGGSVTITAFKRFLQHTSVSHGPSACSTFEALLHQIKLFAGNQIRNTGVLAGNICTASPISDISPVLIAGRSVFRLIDSASGSTRDVAACDFFVGYRKTCMLPSELLLNIFIPFTDERTFVKGYKQSRRRDDDIAIVNAGISMTVDPEGNVADCCISFGGMSFKTITAPKTAAAFIGKQMQPAVLSEALAILRQEVSLQHDAPGGMVEYRQALAQAFVFKFFNSVAKTINSSSIPAEYVSSTEEFHRPLTKGLQHYAPLPKVGVSAVHAPIKHLSGDFHVTGEAQYTDDIPNPPGGLYAGLVLSTQAHARIVSIDPSAALAMPGVAAYVDVNDVKGKNNFGSILQDDETFANGTVICVGQIIGCICADNPRTARQAADAVKIVYETLPPILSIDSAIERGSFLWEKLNLSRGQNLDLAFAGSDVVVEGEVRIGGQEHFYLETNATLCIPGEGDCMTVISSTQNPTKTQGIVAQVLGVPKSKVICKCKRMGGGFGGKETRNVFISTVIAVAAQKLRRPVRIMLERDTDMMITGQRHPFVAKFRAGAMRSGKLTALDVTLYSNGGCTMDLSKPVLERAMFHVDNAYYFPVISVSGFIAKTNLPSNTAFRGFGGPQGIFVGECIMDTISEKLSMDPAVLRRMNMYQQGQVTTFGQVLTECICEETWDHILASSDFSSRKSAVAEFNSKNRWRKRGIAVSPVRFGMSFTATFMNQAQALVHVYTDGSVLVAHGGTEMGQGIHTKMAQVAAQHLGVALDQVTVGDSSTETCANTNPSAASVTADINGYAIVDACEQILRRMSPVRESLLSQGKPASFKDVAFECWFRRVDLSAHGFYRTPDVGFDWAVSKGRPFHYFSFGAAVSEVEIDVLTGDMHILRADMTHDVGKSLNPAVDIGQIEGAFMQVYFYMKNNFEPFHSCLYRESVYFVSKKWFGKLTAVCSPKARPRTRSHHSMIFQLTFVFLCTIPRKVMIHALYTVLKALANLRSCLQLPVSSPFHLQSAPLQCFHAIHYLTFLQFISPSEMQFVVREQTQSVLARFASILLLLPSASEWHAQMTSLEGNR
jgi:xanthine dehydrogenase/oxidase